MAVAVSVVTGATGVTFTFAEDAPAPTALSACTEHEYGTPFVSPPTVTGDAAPVPTTPPGLHVTRYPVMFDPPSLPGAVNAIDALPFPGVAVPIVGAPGTVAAGTTSSVMLCAGSVSDTADPLGVRFGSCVMVLVDFSSHRCTERAPTKPARFTVAGVSPESVFAINITVSAPSLARTLAKTDTLSGFGPVARTLVSPNLPPEPL